MTLGHTIFISFYHSVMNTVACDKYVELTKKLSLLGVVLYRIDSVVSGSLFFGLHFQVNNEGEGKIFFGVTEVDNLPWLLVLLLFREFR